MIYNLKDAQRAAQLAASLMLEEKTHDLSMCVKALTDAAMNGNKTTLRLDAPESVNGITEVQGIITDAFIVYDEKDNRPAQLSIDLRNQNTLYHSDYYFDPSKSEWNTMSRPDSHSKKRAV